MAFLLPPTHPPTHLSGPPSPSLPPVPTAQALKPPGSSSRERSTDISSSILRPRLDVCIGSSRSGPPRPESAVARTGSPRNAPSRRSGWPAPHSTRRPGVASMIGRAAFPSPPSAPGTAQPGLPVPGERAGAARGPGRPARAGVWSCQLPPCRRRDSDRLATRLPRGSEFGCLRRPRRLLRQGGVSFPPRRLLRAATGDSVAADS